MTSNDILIVYPYLFVTLCNIIVYSSWKNMVSSSQILLVEYTKKGKSWRSTTELGMFFTDFSNL